MSEFYRYVYVIYIIYLIFFVIIFIYRYDNIFIFIFSIF